jgi:D-sedoheptulose 7-phosphate isomerase
MTFTSEFLAESVDVIRRIDISAIENAVAILRQVREEGGRLFLAGSGGGAGHASHATCDFRKICDIESYCISDNTSELTARTNDSGWSSAYADWLVASRLAARDCVLVFSVGGGSEVPPVSTNLVNAVRLAKTIGSKTIGIVGRDGGYVAKVADATVLIPSASPALVTPHVEGLQAVVWHLIVSHPSLAVNATRWESLSPTQDV